MQLVLAQHLQTVKETVKQLPATSLSKGYVASCTLLCIPCLLVSTSRYPSKYCENGFILRNILRKSVFDMGNGAKNLHINFLELSRNKTK